MEARRRQLAQMPDAVLRIAVSAFGAKEYKIPKARDELLRKLGEEYRKLWEMSSKALSRKLRAAGVGSASMPKAKADKVQEMGAVHTTLATQARIANQLAGERVASVQPMEYRPSDFGM